MPHWIRSQARAPARAGSVAVEAGENLGGGAAAGFDGTVDGGGVGGAGGFVGEGEEAERDGELVSEAGGVGWERRVAHVGEGFDAPGAVATIDEMGGDVLAEDVAELACAFIEGFLRGGGFEAGGVTAAEEGGDDGFVDGLALAGPLPELGVERGPEEGEVSWPVDAVEAEDDFADVAGENALDGDLLALGEWRVECDGALFEDAEGEGDDGAVEAVGAGGGGELDASGVAVVPADAGDDFGVADMVRLGDLADEVGVAAGESEVAEGLGRFIGGWGVLKAVGAHIGKVVGGAFDDDVFDESAGFGGEWVGADFGPEFEEAVHGGLGATAFDPELVEAIDGGDGVDAEGCSDDGLFDKAAFEVGAVDVGVSGAVGGDGEFADTVPGGDALAVDELGTEFDGVRGDAVVGVDAPAGPVARLEDGDVVASVDERAGGAEAGGSGSDDGDDGHGADGSRWGRGKGCGFVAQAGGGLWARAVHFSATARVSLPG